MAIINTYLSLCGSAVSVYFTSMAVSPARKLTMAHVQNATLAGGVAMAATASMPVQPFGALLIGSIAGIASVLGFKYTQVTQSRNFTADTLFMTIIFKPYLAERFNLHDSCGVNNLHGYPSVISMLASVVMCLTGFHTTDL